MKLLHFILLLTLFTGCNPNKRESTAIKGDAGLMRTSSRAGESIFNLTSVWHSEEGKAIQLEALKGKVLVVVMIYTTCTVACPRLVADMKALHEKVARQKEDDVQYVLVSIDPTHDTPEKLKEFASSKEMDGPEWTFLQGDTESVREFANVLSVKFKKTSPMEFSHSNIISVFSPDGVLVHQQEGVDVDNKETVEAVLSAGGEQ